MRGTSRSNRPGRLDTPSRRVAQWLDEPSRGLAPERFSRALEGRAAPRAVRRPMIPIGTVIDSPQTGERLIFRSTADSSHGELFQAELIVQAGSYVMRSHVHPHQEERFVVLEGRYGWRIGGRTGVAGPGETLVCPIGV